MSYGISVSAKTDLKASRVCRVMNKESRMAEIGSQTVLACHGITA